MRVRLDIFISSILIDCHHDAMILLKLCLILQLCTASITCDDHEGSSLSSPTKVLSRQKRFPALGFLTFAFSLLNSLLLIVQNVMVREVFSQISQGHSLTVH